MLLLPRADKWRPASTPPPRILFCLWLGSLLCIDVETYRPVSLVPFNPTLQFAFSDARQYWEIADLCCYRMKYNLPESLDIRVLMWMRKSLLNPSDKPNLLHKNKSPLVSYICRLSFAQRDSDVAHHSWPSALLPMRQSVKMSQRACVNLWQWWRAWVTASGGWGGGILGFGWMNPQWQLPAASCQNTRSQHWASESISAGASLLDESIAPGEKKFPTSQFHIDKNSAVRIIVDLLLCVLNYRGGWGESKRNKRASEY